MFVPQIKLEGNIKDPTNILVLGDVIKGLIVPLNESIGSMFILMIFDDIKVASLICLILIYAHDSS